MQRGLIFGIIGLAAGLLIGFFGANALNREAAMQRAPESSSIAAGDAVSPPAGSNAGGMTADVAATLAKAEAEPQNFAAQMKTGDMYAQIGKFDRAVEFYKKGIALKPSDFQANVVLANALFDSRQFEEAAEYYTKALEIKPDDLNARTDLGATFVERPDPDFERGIAEFEKVLQTDPKHEPSLYYLGVAYFRKGSAADAQKTLERLEKANPSSGLITRLRQNITPK